MRDGTITLEEISCPICASGAFSEHFRAVDNSGTAPGAFRLVRCDGCNLIYLNPRPTVTSLGACYGAEYAAHRAPDDQRLRKLTRIDRAVLARYYGWRFVNGSGPAWLAGLFRKTFASHRKNIRFFPFEGAGRVLDVGCGSGAYLEILREGGWSVAGVEIDPDAAERAGAMRSLDVHAGTILDAPFPLGSFDVVTMWHVLEHVWNPNEVVDRVAELLAPGGLFVVSTPAIDGYAAATLREHWYHIDVPRHLLHFTRKRLTGFIADRGFDVERVVDDARGSGWRLSYDVAPEEVRRQEWFRRLATDKKHRHAYDRELAARGEASIVVVYARKKKQFE